MTTQNKAKRKKGRRWHQDRYSKFLASKKFVLEKKFCLEGEEFSDIQAIVARGWVELT